jgi:hypothetical protein
LTQFVAQTLERSRSSTIQTKALVLRKINMVM